MTNPTTTDTDAQPLEATALRASLTVKDVAASRDWYRDALGFTVAREMERDGALAGVVLTAGAVRLIVNQDNGARGWDRTKGEGFSLSIVVSGSVDAVADRIKAYGGTLDSEPADMPWGQRAFRVTDPDGYRFAIAADL